MRIPGPLGLQRARGRGGVVLEDDGEITLPPVSQPVGDFSAPLEVVGLSGSTAVATTFVVGGTFFINGVTAGTNIDYGPMTSGTWRLKIKIILSTTNMTPDQTKGFRVQLVDPAGGITNLWSAGYLSTRDFVDDLDFEITFPRNGFIIRQTFAVTVALDVAEFFVGVKAFRIL